jgi:DNA-binding transcriptional ArsR family regulator
MATDQLSRTFSALADPTRRAILGMLSRGEATVGDIAAPFSMSLPAISKHLQVLERAGLISRGRDAQWRPARLNAATLAPAADWIDGYRQFWEHSFNALDHHLTKNKKGTT